MARRGSSKRRSVSHEKKVTVRTASARKAAITSRSGFSIKDNRLVGPGVSFVETPNKGGEISPRYLVFHYTAGKSAANSIGWLTNPESQASAHLVVARNGRVTQLAPFNVKAWHAGISHWDGLSGLNSYSIGIEMDNAGPLKKVGDKYQAWFGTLYGEGQVIYGKHKLDDQPRWWHAYKEVQIRKALELAQLLVRHYNLKDIVGHEDIAPDRKRDPGPAFPLEHIRARVLGREEEGRAHYEVTASALNIRSGPGVEFLPIAEPLTKGTIIALLEKRDRWSKVELPENGDVEGWVRNQFLKKV